ncbi:hypothetical protein PSEUBRA_006320 [Kalmanozyma brasiliensis GHG001]|uniref:uncharacterized protein n=1 Tax=Kalmanozyma brasiliensis (strain GHG001) TaxID=1365824 RepID=UPI002867EB23|nr:uncharacterized protein PSEUBRA_006320 [Kalmanozyma brasiliensis GHG001]KAF6767658.1 hypothetical protein PSEUBRA_006320 [Kalmanozyma brasiliensis GHG001]
MRWPARGYFASVDMSEPAEVSSNGGQADALHLDPSIGSPGDDSLSSMSSTPSLTSTASTLSRSTSIRSAASERNYFQGGTRYVSLNVSTDLSTAGLRESSPDRATSKWTQRARSWSNTMSRRMSITAWNHTLHSTTSPYLKAGLEELRSIFDVDSLGAAIDDQDGTDLEDAPTFGSYAGHRRPFFGATGGRDAENAAAQDQAFSESPQGLSPDLSRLSSSEHRRLQSSSTAKRHGMCFKSQLYEPPATHHRSQSWRKHRSLSVSDLPSQASPESTADKETILDTQRGSSASCFSTRNTFARSRTSRTPFVAVGLAAISIVIVGVCALETSVHPDAASLPLTTFMLAQSGFALTGIVGLALQKRWMSDLASRLIRAHVLCQVLIALAALRNLSRTAFYHDRLEVQNSHGAAAAGMLTSPRFLAAHQRVTDPHSSSVGSVRDQVMYLCVFAVQAALPLAFVLWAQYALASALSRATRSFSKTRGADKQPQDERQQFVPLVKLAREDRSAAPRTRRMRFNSENPTLSKSSSQDILNKASGRNEGWLGFVITRLDIDEAAPVPPRSEIDAAELTSRLEELARSVTPTPRNR